MKPFLAIALLTLATSACKPSGGGDSQVQSLDNFTRADGAEVKQNSCGFKITETSFKKLSAKDQKALDYIDAPSRDLALDALGAMAAVPRPLLSLFFKLDGRVRVVSDTKAACADAKLSPAERKFAGEGTGELDGCWNASGKHFEIIVKADHAAIHHAMVRIFGYVYTQYVPTFDFSKLGAADQAQAKATLANLKKQKQAIGDALLADLAKKGGAVSARFAQFSAASEDQYEDFSVAEAIDSRYCSKAVRKVFEKDFPRTFAAFTGPQSLESDLGAAFYE